MKKMINKTHVEGLVYENELKLNVAGPTAKNPGMEYINGRLSILTDNGTNVVEVQLYEGAITSKGATNGKFATAKALLDAKTVIADGIELATAIKIDSAINLNEWFKQDQLVSTPRNSGGFIHIVPKAANPSATFETDILIVNSIPEILVRDGETVETGRLVVNGYIFDFANKIMPVKFIVENELGVKFFEALEPNTFTKVWGNQVSSTIKTSRTEESAFGENKVIESEYTRKEWVITGSMKEPYAEDNLLTTQEIQSALANRNVYLAETKKRAEDRQAQRDSTPGAGFGTPGANKPAGNALGGLNLGAGGFNF